MLTDTLEQLRNARGESCQVLVVFVDVRGFSSFAGVAESTDTALFLRAIYTRLIDKYFTDPDFFKPTGDGLMLVRELGTDAEGLIRATQEWITSALTLVEEFSRITNDDLLINIAVPERVGVGIARGSATKLIGNDGMVIDYSGRCLNLAARLMDLARPEGVVFQDKHAAALLGDDLASRMSTDMVYIKGIADDTPIEVYLSSEWVTVPAAAKTPIAYEPSFEEPTVFSVKTVREHSDYLIPVGRKPRADSAITVVVEYEPYNEDGTPCDKVNTKRFPGEYLLEPSGHYVKVEFTGLHDDLKKDHVPDTEEMTFTPFF
jgi:class 3 adenylate cyclase